MFMTTRPLLGTGNGGDDDDSITLRIRGIVIAAASIAERDFCYGSSSNNLPRPLIEMMMDEERSGETPISSRCIAMRL